MLNGLMMASGNVDVLAVALTDTDSATTSTTPQTFSSVALGNAATSRRMIVCITYRADGNRTISAVTVGGASGTRLMEASSGAQRNAEAWIADVPSGSTGDVVITSDSDLTEVAISMYRTTGLSSTTTPHDTALDNTASTFDVNLDINTLTDSIIIAVAHSEDSNLLAWEGITEASDFTWASRPNTHSSAADVVVSGETPRTINGVFDNAPNNERSISLCIQ